MNANTNLRRTIYTVGAAATLGLVLAGPASAKPEPGEPVTSSSGGTTTSRIVKVPVVVDDNALEPVQLAGLAIKRLG